MAGNGIGSFIIRTREVINITIAVYPCLVRPEGRGNRINTSPIIIAYINHLFWVAQKRKLLNERFENPNNNNP
jgi:hypothetical protein